MKLLLVNHEYPPVGGGAATASQALARHLSALGHNVIMMTADHGKLPDDSDAGIIICPVQCLRRRADRSDLFEMFTFMVAGLLRLPFVLAKHRPDALIVFFSLPGGPFGLIAKLCFGLPYVVSLRGGDVPGLVCELNFVHKMAAPLRRAVLKHACAVVANSEELRKLSEAADGYPVHVIPNGVDAEVFRPDPTRSTSSPAGGPLRILFIGRFQEQKNLAFLFQQVARLPTGSFNFHLVGDGPQRKRLSDLAEKLGIAPSITWHGWLPRSELPAVYQSADCFVNPSLYEGMPNVVLEAMASGLPVIASKIPGNDALVVEGETGFLFDLDNPDGLNSALEKMHDVDLRRRMGQCSRARAEKCFSWKGVALDYASLLSSKDLGR